VIRAVQDVVGRPFEVREAARRPGDPATLVADSSRARRELGWQPAFPKLHEMVETAWQWRSRHPTGYAS
jgi:UDP-glucose 4-epimerase